MSSRTLAFLQLGFVKWRSHGRGEDKEWDPTVTLKHLLRSGICRFHSHFVAHRNHMTKPKSNVRWVFGARLIVKQGTEVYVYLPFYSEGHKGLLY